MQCLFCNIINKTLPASIVYEDRELLILNDIHPRAPIHQLIIPKKHIATLNELQSEDTSLIGKMVLMTQKLALDHHMSQEGYRAVFNCNTAGGQEVYHLHLHFLAGRQMHWPPG